MNNKIIISILIGALLLLGLKFLTSNQTNPVVNNPSTDISPTLDIPQRATLEGDVICLSHKDTNGPQTLECAIGIDSTQGIFALDTNLISSQPPNYTVGDYIKGSGVLTPIERLSTDQWQKYDMQGIFSLTEQPEIISSLQHNQ
jgi:hypothetical protein